MASSSSNPMDTYSVRASGDPKTDQWRLFYELKDGTPISPFHDIPLHTGRGTFNFVCEIPRGLNAKLEINKTEVMNPIKQDIKRGNLRFVHDVHPYNGYIWNYGAFPQTWEDPTNKDEGTGAYGDNDPLDVCEIGSETATVGQVKEVKVLGVLALIDEGETDWKVLTIDVNDPLASQLNDISDVERVLPGLTMASYEWFRTYKIPAGSPANEFAFKGQAKDRAFALNIIEENHHFWRKLHTGETPASGTKLGNGEKYEVVLASTQLSGDLAVHKISVDEAKASVKDLGNHGTPTSNTSRTADDSTGSVAEVIEEAQRNKPHGTATLAAVLAEASAAVHSGDDEAVWAALSAAKTIRAVSFGDKSVEIDAERHYSVVVRTVGEGHIFGVFQRPSPHPLPQAANIAQALGLETSEELVGAGFVDKDHSLVLASGCGSTFAFKHQKFISHGHSSTHDVVSHIASL